MITKTLKQMLADPFYILFPRCYTIAIDYGLTFPEMIQFRSEFICSPEDFDLYFRTIIAICHEKNINLYNYTTDFTQLALLLPLRPAHFITRYYKKKEIDIMTGQAEFFEPKGIYRVIFHEEGDRGTTRIAQGRIANYASGNIVLHNDETGELLITRFSNIDQVFRIKKEAPNGV